MKRERTSYTVSKGDDNMDSMNDVDKNKSLNHNKNQTGPKEMDEMAQAPASTRTEAAVNDWITTGEAAKRLGIRSVNTVKRWINTGLLVGWHPKGGWVRVSAASVQKLLEANSIELRRLQFVKQELEATKDLGGEITQELLDDLSMSKLGNLPWQVSESE